MSPMVEGFLLFLIELCFITIIGLIYTIPVVIAVFLSEWIKKKWNERKNDDRQT